MVKGLAWSGGLAERYSSMVRNLAGGQHGQETSQHGQEAIMVRRLAWPGRLQEASMTRRLGGG